MEIVHLIGATAKAVSSVKKFADGFIEREMYATRLWDSLQDLGIRLDRLNLVDLDAAVDQAWYLENDSKGNRPKVERLDHGRRSLFNMLSAQDRHVRGQCMAGALFIKAMLANVEDSNRDEDFIRSIGLFAWCKTISDRDLSYFAGGDSRSRAVASFVYEPLWRATGKFAHGEDTMFNARWFRDHGLRNVFPGMPVYPEWSGSKTAKSYTEHSNALKLFVEKKHLIKSKGREKTIFSGVHPSLFASSGEHTGQLLNGFRGHEALFLSASLGGDHCKIVYHPFDVAFIRWIARGQSLSLVSAKDDICNLDAVIPRYSPYWSTVQEWLFIFPPSNHSLPASLQAASTPLTSMRRVGEYHFYAVASTSDVFVEEKNRTDPANLQYQEGEIIAISNLDFTRMWDPKNDPPSLWFHGEVNGKEMDIFGKYLYPVYNHYDPSESRLTFCGKDRQMMIKRTGNPAEEDDDIIPGRFETYPKNTLLVGIECQTSSQWYDTDDNMYFPSSDVVVVNQDASWREYIDTIYRSQFDEHGVPYDLADYWD